MPGKDPHRPEGKTADAEHMHARREMERLQASLQSPPAEHAPEPTRVPAEESIGGSRARVPSRMNRALEEMDEGA